MLAARSAVVLSLIESRRTDPCSSDGVRGGGHSRLGSRTAPPHGAWMQFLLAVLRLIFVHVVLGATPRKLVTRIFGAVACFCDF